MTDIADLSHDDQVALWAGRVVRKEAEIESMLRSIYYQLCGGGMSWVVVPQQFAAITKGIRNMLKASTIDEDYKADCYGALNRLGLAHEMRNRVVHDQWVMREPGRFTSAAKGVTDGTKPEEVWDLGEFERCFMELRFCYAMISGMYWSIGSVLDGGHLFKKTLPRNREAIAGRIRMTSDTSWEFTDPTFTVVELERIRREQEAFDAEMVRLYGKH